METSVLELFRDYKETEEELREQNLAKDAQGDYIEGFFDVSVINFKQSGKAVLIGKLKFKVTYAQAMNFTIAELVSKHMPGIYDIFTQVNIDPCRALRDKELKSPESLKVYTLPNALVHDKITDKSIPMISPLFQQGELGMSSEDLTTVGGAYPYIPELSFLGTFCGVQLTFPQAPLVLGLRADITKYQNFFRNKSTVYLNWLATMPEIFTHDDRDSPFAGTLFVDSPYSLMHLTHGIMVDLSEYLDPKPYRKTANNLLDDLVQVTYSSKYLRSDQEARLTALHNEWKNAVDFTSYEETYATIVTEQSDDEALFVRNITDTSHFEYERGLGGDEIVSEENGVEYNINRLKPYFVVTDVSPERAETEEGKEEIRKQNQRLKEATQTIWNVAVPPLFMALTIESMFITGDDTQYKFVFRGYLPYVVRTSFFYDDKSIIEAFDTDEPIFVSPQQTGEFRDVKLFDEEKETFGEGFMTLWFPVWINLELSPNVNLFSKTSVDKWNISNRFIDKSPLSFLCNAFEFPLEDVYYESLFYDDVAEAQPDGTFREKYRRLLVTQRSPKKVDGTPITGEEIHPTYFSAFGAIQHHDVFKEDMLSDFMSAVIFHKASDKTVPVARDVRMIPSGYQNGPLVDILQAEMNAGSFSTPYANENKDYDFPGVEDKHATTYGYEVSLEHFVHVFTLYKDVVTMVRPPNYVATQDNTIEIELFRMTLEKGVSESTGWIQDPTELRRPSRRRRRMREFGMGGGTKRVREKLSSLHLL